MSQPRWITDSLREGLLTPDALQRAQAELVHLQHQGQQVTLPALLHARYLPAAARDRFEALVRDSARLQATAREPTLPLPDPRGATGSGRLPTQQLPERRPPVATPPPRARPQSTAAGSRRFEEHGAPTQLGHYEVLEEIARGGMGVIYRARDPRLGREVAIKLLLADGPERRKRFQREAQAISRLEHPNVIPIHEVGESPSGQPYLVMSLLTQGSLQDRLAQGPLPPREAARLGQQLAVALQYAHEHMILHRDVKPDNVLVGDHGQPVLTDFGLAKFVDAGASRATKSGVMVGTPSYMPPEQADSKRLVDWRADVYGLGATLYALLTGEPPFQGGTQLELMVQIAGLDPAPPSSRRPGVPKDLDTIVLTCLEKDPADRYPTAAELAADLGRFLEHRTIQAAPPSVLARVKRWRRRNTTVVRVGAVAAGLVVAVSLGAVTWARYASAQQEARELARLRSAVLAHARPATKGPGAQPSNPEERLGAALAALQAAQSWSSRAPEDLEARRAHYAAALELGDAAAARRQWVLAGEAYRGAAELGVDDARATDLMHRAQRAATGLATARAREVNRWLDRVASGELHSVPEGLTEAEFAIVRNADHQTVELLAARLDAISARNLEAQAQILRELVEPDAEERRAGESALEGCEDAIRLRALPLDVERDEASSAAAQAFFEAAIARLGARNAREVPLEVRQNTPSGDDVLARRTSEALGQGRVDLARVCCNALGRLCARSEAADSGESLSPPEAVDPGGLAPSHSLRSRDRADRALRRYLYTEVEPDRAVHAAKALIRLDPRRSHDPFLRFKHSIRFNAQLVALTNALARDRVASPPGGEATPDAEDSEGAYARGQACLDRGDTAAAEVAFARATELAPERADAHVQLGALRANRGAIAEARADLDRALALDPRNSDALLQRAMLAVRTRSDLEQAVRDATLAVETGANRAEGFRLRALIHLLLGAPAQASADLERCLTEDPSNVGALSQRAELRRATDPAGALRDLSRAIELAPTQGDLWLNRGQTRLLGGDPQGALDDLDRAAELAADDAQVLLFRGHALHQLGRWHEALQSFQRAVELEPANLSALDGLANLLGLLGRMPEGLALMDRLVELKPQDPVTRANRGAARFTTGNVQGAFDDVDAAIELDPTYANPWTNRGHFLTQLGRHAEALPQHDRALELDPNLAIAWHNKGVTLSFWRDKLEEAIVCFTRAAELDPRHSETRARRAECYLVLGRLEEALADYQHGVEVSPQNPMSWLGLGNAYLYLNRPAEALERFDKAIALDSRLGQGWLARGLAHKAAGNVEAAKRDLTQALELLPANPPHFRQQANRLLRELGD